MNIAWTHHPTQAFTRHVRLPARSEGLEPKEIWRRQCWAGASLMPRAQSEMGHAVGIDPLMWGSDYPHVEGTWPHTRQFLADAFSRIPETEVGQMVGENAAQCYGFDRRGLTSIAERVGPEFH